MCRRIFNDRAGVPWLLLGFVVLGPALSGFGPDEDLIEAIGNVPVVDSSRPEDRLFQTPVGAFTFDEDAITNLPVNSIPEMLRFAPGVHIQRATNGVWGMGIRGMNSRFFGRTVFAVDEQNPYGDLLGGIFGSVHVMLLDDISSVEVVRGPGGGLWGANASNGMVNVIPKTAFETEGAHLLLRGGSEEQWAQVRYGWKTGERSAARVYALANHRDPSASNLDDSWETYRVGFRFDRRPDDRSLFSLSVESYGSELSAEVEFPDLATGILEVSREPEKHTGSNAQAKWLRNFSNGGGIVTRAWVGNVSFDSMLGLIELLTVGAEARVELPWSEGHTLSLTAGFIGDQIDYQDDALLTFTLDGLDRTQVKLGARETWAFADQWSVSAGATGTRDSSLQEWFVQPDVRLTFSPSNERVWWASASRALRAFPAALRVVENGATSFQEVEPVTIVTPLGPQVISRMVFLGRVAEDVEAEELNAYELGHRRQISSSITLGVSAFYNEYDQIAHGQVEEAPVPVLFIPEPYFAQTMYFDNAAKGYAQGGEVDLAWKVSNRWRVKLAYSYIQNHFKAITSSSDPLLQMVNEVIIAEIENNVPQHLGSLWVTWKPVDGWRFDGTLRYDDGFTSPTREVQRNTQLDLRISWEPDPLDRRWRWSLVGRNLLDPATDESGLKEFIGVSSEIEREWYLEVRYAF